MTTQAELKKIIREVLDEYGYSAAPEASYGGFSSDDIRNMFARFFHSDREAPKWHTKAPELARYLQALKIDDLNQETGVLYSQKGTKYQRGYTPHAIYTHFKKMGYSLPRRLRR